ncbi:S8/S53 family peptidase [Mesorhizobium sp. Cs1299R1N1]|uniref:S8/S53 family peptidase n=1 Tax=Mesorhizobium sp. Cs1299R1N1 TaxID=3015172 RepID=UPI00301D3B24
MRKIQSLPVGLVAGLFLCLTAKSGFAGDLSDGGAAAELAGSSSSGCPQNADGTFCWMSPDIGQAWASGYTGSGVSVTIVDDFTSNNEVEADLGLGPKSQPHGKWVAEIAGMVAPGANMSEHDYNYGIPLSLQDGLNVVNLSYASLGPADLDPVEKSIVDVAWAGTAFIAKSAGNHNIRIGTGENGESDFLALELMGAPTTIFVGALDHNGTPENKAKLASYSNYPGLIPELQNQFLTVGVEDDKTGLRGTSYGAPVISGYAAILGSKFTTATPIQISNQLLDTARTDTIVNYDPETYGRGEASLSRALAPISIR